MLYVHKYVLQSTRKIQEKNLPGFYTTPRTIKKT